LSAARTFFKLKYSLFVPKTPLFNGHFALSNPIFYGSEGFVYTISADIYAHRFAFSSKLHCI
jgi:hypothetical protein